MYVCQYHLGAWPIFLGYAVSTFPKPAAVFKMTVRLWLQMLRSIVDVNLPKFLAHDVPLFHGIINDLFPGVNLPRVEHTQFLEAVDRICQQNNLQIVSFFTEKLIQMYEMMLVRHG